MKAAAQLARINLLPHRHAARRRRAQALLWLLAGGALLGLLLSVLAGAWLQHRLDKHLQRQDAARRAMRQAETVLATGQQVRRDTAALLLRQQAIAGLQAQRPAWVHMLVLLARAMPAGVALHSVREEAAMVRLQGHAVSQEQVAALLLALEEAAPWSRPELLEVRDAAGGTASGAVAWTVRLALASGAAPAPRP